MMKQSLEFVMSRAVIRIFRILPFSVLYLISGVFFVLVYYLLGTRRKIVNRNMRNAFPEKREAEISRLSRLFYMHLFDMYAEFFKGLTMTEEALAGRFELLNPEMIGEVLSMGKGAIVLVGHYGNFEWGKVLFRRLKHPVIIFYNLFSNARSFDYYAKTQNRFGMNLVPVSGTLRTFYEQRGIPNWYFMAADQRPTDGSVSISHSFLNQATGFYYGYEEIARKFNIPVIFLDIQRVKKGRYTVNAIMLSSEPAKTEKGEITGHYIKTLEGIIRRRPEDWWLWKREWL